MIGPQNERFCIANYDMQPMKQTGTGIVSLMLVRKVFQGSDVTAITVAVDHTVFCEGGLSKFSDGSLLDIGSDLHFEMAWIPLAVQRQCNENLHLFRTTTPFFAGYRPAKVSIIKINHSIKLMRLIPLAHGFADALEHIPSGLVGRAKLGRQLHSRDLSLILAHQI